MLYVRIELWPDGDRTQAKFMGEAKIVNDRTGDQTVGNYTVELTTWHDPPRTWKKGYVRGFLRKSLGPFDLLFRALCATVASRNQLRVRPPRNFHFRPDQEC